MRKARRGVVLCAGLAALALGGCKCAGNDGSTDTGGPGTDATGPTDSGPGDSGTASDAGPTDSGPGTDAFPPSTCGNVVVEPPEACDDANMSEDDFCLNDCTLACGDGVLNVVELCDTGIGAGSAGACPTSCDDGDACTTDTVSGSECTTECVYGTIGVPFDGDLCCPPGANETNDSDCSPVCDNGVLETGETCEPMATCPLSCNDGDSCTSDALTGSAATCDSACVFMGITACVAGDSCCPAACTSATDADCSPTCGNGVLDSGETCDPTSTCPTSCNDGNPCTSDALSGNPLACSSSCPYAPITTPVNGDLCCPAGANANNDNDCLPFCGNSVIETGEQCDDGGTIPGDGCDAACQLEGPPPTVFRFSDLDLKDPHIYIDTGIPFIGCQDVTNMVPLGLAPSVNASIQTAITTDGTDADTFLDLSFLLIFRPLDQIVGAMGVLDVATGDCTSPIAGTSCDLAMGTMTTPTTFTNMGMGSTCLAPIVGTTSGYSPGITDTTGPCFVSGTVDFTLTIGGAMITLAEGQVAGTYVGLPATSLSNGLERGFLSEADADAAIIDVPGFGMMPISELLPGGTGNCASGDDRDIGPDGLTMGWWFYLNFPATAVTYTGP